MGIVRAISMRHSAYCCAKCSGPIRLMPNVMSGPENHYAYCGSCGWKRGDIVSDTELGAITAWNAAVRKAMDVQGVPPEALPMSDAAIVEACARVQGWINFPSDGAEGAHTWYMNAETAPFCECIDMLRYNPIKHSHQANEVAFTLRMILQYDVAQVTATTPELQALGFSVTVPVAGEENRSAAEAGGDAMQRAIATVAARHYQHGFHLTANSAVQLDALCRDVATSDLRARAIATRTPCPECHTEQVEFIGARPEPKGHNAFWRCRHCKHEWEREIDDA